VLFTSPPPGLAGDHWREDERLVNVTFGLGAPVVDGAASADTVRIARQGGVVGEVIAEKRRALVVGAAGLEEIAVPDAEVRAPALSPDALRELSRIADRLEASAGKLFPG